MDLLDEYGTDTDAERDGVWSPDFRGGMEFQIRSSNSPEVKKALQRVAKRTERYWKLKQDVPEAIQRKNNLDVICATVADWRLRIPATKAGDEDVVQSAIPFGGTALECTDENKKTVFADPRIWSLRQDIITQSNEIERYKSAELEEDAGNSAPPSAPSASSAASQDE